MDASVEEGDARARETRHVYDSRARKQANDHEPARPKDEEGRRGEHDLAEGPARRTRVQAARRYRLRRNYLDRISP